MEKRKKIGGSNVEKGVTYSFRAIGIFLNGLYDKYFENKDEEYLRYLLKNDLHEDLSQLKKFRLTIEKTIQEAEKNGDQHRIDAILDFFNNIIIMQESLENKKEEFKKEE
jgi:hypothetical protein